LRHCTARRRAGIGAATIIRSICCQIIQEGMLVNGIGRDRIDCEQRAARALTDAGLGDFALNRFPHEFSGGQRQRIAIPEGTVYELLR
jgi:peptide/nickel transport system ATP-binding protein